MTPVEIPASHATVRELHVGEQVALKGTLFTLRPAVYDYLHSGGDLPFLTEGSIVYHAGPVGKKRGKKWTVQSVAPDHSSPLDPWVRELFVRFGIRGIIGRGELGKQTLDSCRQFGACYFQTIAGAGPLLATRVKEVRDVHMADKFDNADAVWELEVEDFPAIVTIDSHGQSLHDMIRDVSTRRLINLQL
ncbi:MAG: fumarate hydratase C-terminal domain-containing protein [Planctomycetes bacterium]|nr:fumarate hydratase C-terminal domain-containing protein [Planctomycetota bacterium]